MSLIASEILDESREVYLNDSGATTWTNTKLLPYLKKAYDDLQRTLLKEGLVELDEISAVLAIPAGTTSLVESALQPSDLIQPIDISERLDSTEEWQDMEQKTWEPSDSYNDYDRLDVWTWREADVKFRGANRALEILIYYRKSLSEITGENSIIPVLNSKGYLSARTAALAAGFGGAAATRATMVNSIATQALDEIRSIKAKDNQLPVRRKSYGSTRRRLRGW